ncbi:hypothetical protein ANCDUO_11615 [Ancylostoma duodenale]|uniref:Uncharacterized protein n=1 Tax=Ancylostoma duodenale TaxID=51022 RepID=A0A0C2GH37_9BILA|nr:hypothetical protein ANCDUO_11615 [Ancylostoma duodenale]
MPPQQYQPGFVHAPVQQQYQPPIVQAPVQQQYVPQQPMVHVQSPMYQQPQQMRPQYAVPVATSQQYVEVPKTEQQHAMPYQPVVYGQWLQPAGEQYQENVGESDNVDSSVDTERTDPQVTTAPLPLPIQSHMG